MRGSLTRVRELAAWGLDDHPYRGNVFDSATAHAHALLAERSSFEQPTPVLDHPPEALLDLLTRHAERPDLLAEMSALRWSLGLVDLRALVAFQRRLVFPADVAPPLAPAADDWLSLFALSFGPPRPVIYESVRDASTQTVVLTSSNPDLHLRFTKDVSAPLTLHAGSPFLEVASFRERWFLRDGYHRAYALLRAHVFMVPAVLVHASMPEELGANRPWFFPEAVLFSPRPPLVTDFLNQDLVIEYDRPAFFKTLRITIEEDLKPATFTGESL